MNKKLTFTFPANKESRTIVICGVIIAFLLGACVCLLVMKTRQRVLLDDRINELVMLREAYPELEAKLTSTTEGLKNAGQDYFQIDARLNDNLESLEQAKNQIAGLLKKKSVYTAGIVHLKTQIAPLKRQIKGLKEKHSALSREKPATPRAEPEASGANKAA